MRHHARVPRAIGNYTVDGTANFRVLKLRLGSLQDTFRGYYAGLCSSQLLFMSDGFQALQMAFRLFVLCFGLYERDGRGIKVLSRNCALSEQVLAAVIDLLLSVEVFLGGLRVQFSFLQFLGK